MPEYLQKKQTVSRLAERMSKEDKEAALWLDASTETLYEAIVVGESVTYLVLVDSMWRQSEIPGFSSLIPPSASDPLWAGHPPTGESKQQTTDG